MGDMVMQSVYQPNVALPAGGTSRIAVSASGAQLLQCQDTAGQLRGLTLSIPSQSNAAAQGRATTAAKKNAAAGTTPSLTVDAASTATALIYMTTGILAIDHSVASQRILQIQQLPSFQPLVTYLVQTLPTTPLQSLSSNIMLAGLVSTCVSDWQAAHAQGPSIQSHISGAATGRSMVSDKNGRFSASASDGDKKSSIKVSLVNAEWRLVHVDRQIVDGNGNELAVRQPLYTAVAGTQPYDWGNLFTGTAGKPTQIDDIIDLTPYPNAAEIVYWVRGPGLRAESSNGDVYRFNLPSSITSSEDEAWVMSLVYYGVMPLLDLILGGTFILEKLFGENVGGIIEAIWARVKGKVDPSNWINVETDGTLDIFREDQQILTLLTVDLLGLAALVLNVLEFEDPVAVVITDLAIAAAGATFALSAANLMFAVRNWVLVGHIGEYRLPVPQTTG